MTHMKTCRFRYSLYRYSAPHSVSAMSFPKTLIDNELYSVRMNGKEGYIDALST